MSDKKIVMPLEDIMGDRFGSYSKYIIQDRALPDVRDGLKPVQRRILYAMYKEGNTHNKPYRKSAKTVGNVIGNYHPHGDTSVYDAMVRLSQEWKMRVPLVDMQGNNGSIDNDPAAAMRYTEARLSKMALDLLQDIDKETVNMALNFDDTEYEPTVLPAKYPNVLVNGATGISAGYATDIPPHNFEEVIDATIYRIKHPKCKFEELLQIVKGPDFPTGAIVEGKEEIANALKTGKGKVMVRSKVRIEETKNLNVIVVDEIPYEVNKADMVRKIDEIRFNREIDGIVEVRDESDRNGLRVVIEVKKEANVQNILNYLYKNTELAKNYSYNMVAIKNKRPELMGLSDILDAYIEHAIDFTTRRCKYDLNKAQSRNHIVEGLMKAISILDDVVHTIRHSKNKMDAKMNLIIEYGFSEAQAEAIVTLQLYRLTNTDIVALQNEQAELNKTITELNELLADEKKMRKHIIASLNNEKKEHNYPRLTEIKDEIEDTNIDKEAMIIPEDIYISITRDGYIKRISQRSFKAANGAPIGKKEDDILLYLSPTNTIHKLLLFTSQGNYLYIPLHMLEEFRYKELGKHISYLIKLTNEEKIVDALIVQEFNDFDYLVLISKNGQIKRTLLKEFDVTRYSKPIKCMNLKEDDELFKAFIVENDESIMLVSKNGYSSMYPVENIQTYGIKASGVKGMNVPNDEIIGAVSFDPTSSMSITILSTEGKAKRILCSKIPLTTKGSKGISLYKRNKKTNEELAGIALTSSKEDTVNIVKKDYSVVEFHPFSVASKDLEASLTNISDLDSVIYVGNIDIPVISHKEKKKEEEIEQIKPKFEKVQLDFDF